MSGRVLIFDFDGTIADTHHYIVRISNGLAAEFGYGTIDWNEIERWRDKTVMEVIRQLGVPLLKIPRIISRAKQEFHKGIHDVQPIPGLLDALTDLRNSGIQLGILSSNTADNIEGFLRNHGLDVFDFVQSTSKIWSKNVSLQRICGELELRKEDIFYVGDEVRDVSAAKKSGVGSVAVTWGYNSERALGKLNPDFMVSDPTDLLQFAV